MPGTGTISYTIRQLLHNDVAAYKAMRLEALQTEPGMFGNSYAMEAAYPGEHWEHRCTNPGCAIWGLYANDELIGITGIIQNAENPAEGYMTQSYIRRAHRGKHLSRLLYGARIAWAKEHGISRLVISHKASNISSKAANQRFGFTYTHSENRTWPDGTTEDNLYYELILK